MAPISRLMERKRCVRVRALLVTIRILVNKRSGVSFWMEERKRIESQLIWGIIVTSHC